MDKEGFKRLIVWQKSKDLAVQIYRISSKGLISKDFGLRDQIQRSAVSIPSNIAEGDERETDKGAIRFFFISKGSLAEIRTQLQIAFEIGYINKNEFHTLDDEYRKLGKMIGALIKARRKKD